MPVAEGVPVGMPTSDALLRQHCDEEIARFEARAREKTKSCLKKINEAADTVVAAKVPREVRAVLENDVRTQSIVSALTTDLEQRVLATAPMVVARVAEEESAKRALSAAIEERLMKRIDQRIGAFWVGATLGAAGMGVLTYFGLRTTR